MVQNRVKNFINRPCFFCGCSRPEHWVGFFYQTPCMRTKRYGDSWMSTYRKIVFGERLARPLYSFGNLVQSSSCQTWKMSFNCWLKSYRSVATRLVQSSKRLKCIILNETLSHFEASNSDGRVTTDKCNILASCKYTAVQKTKIEQTILSDCFNFFFE